MEGWLTENQPWLMTVPLYRSLITAIDTFFICDECLAKAFQVWLTIHHNFSHTGYKRPNSNASLGYHARIFTTHLK